MHLQDNKWTAIRFNWKVLFCLFSCFRKDFTFRNTRLSDLKPPRTVGNQLYAVKV